MLEILVLIVVLSALANGWFVRYILPDPYRDIAAPKPYSVEIPDCTFDSRGLV